MRTAIVALIFAVANLDAQPAQPRSRDGWEFTGIPALNFNADEGFGYGVVGQASYYRPGDSQYRMMLQPTVLFTTRGRRDVSLFLDAPRLMPPGWRLSGILAREQQLATPYYGVGNSTAHDETAELEPNPYFYRFGRTGIRFSTDVQRTVWRSLRVLGGVGFRTAEIDRTPFDSGTTLLDQETGAAVIPDGRTATVRVGLVLDTRDRYVGPRHGVWIDALAQRGSRVTETTEPYTRFTLTARGYASPTERVTVAERLVLQNVTGDVPFYELFTVQSSFRDDEGLGGASSLRGWPKNRFAGKGLALLNSEVRVRAADFSLRGRESSVVLSGFVDGGRVWADRLDLGAIASDLHLGFGGGARLAYGRSFVVATDVGHSKESGAAIYIGLGYLY